MTAPITPLASPLAQNVAENTSAHPKKGPAGHAVRRDEEPERAVLISVDDGSFDAETSLRELRELAKTAGATVLATLVQKRESPDKATFLGSGRTEELSALCETNGADLVIADAELSPTQHRNLEERLPCRVVDRTALILDIFAARARSAEGRLQVELAQLQYRLPRLAGQGTALSRLGGGIGTRGPGETKLENDRRYLRRRIGAIKEQLQAVEQQRRLRRDRRRKDSISTVALVGYTNAGKSTLLNRLTDADVPAEDKLFATLDPTARALRLPDGRQVLLVDTVGFVRRLPHQLVQAFHATLEEAVEADVILNVCDASSPEAEEHLSVTNALLAQLGCGDRPILPILNQCDRCFREDQKEGKPWNRDATAATDGSTQTDLRPAPLLQRVIPDVPGAVCISALTGEGIPALLAAVAAALPPDRRRVTLLLPFSEGGLAQQCRQEGAVESETYVPEGLHMTVTLGTRLLEQVREYVCDSDKTPAEAPHS